MSVEKGVQTINGTELKFQVNMRALKVPAVQ